MYGTQQKGERPFRIEGTLASGTDFGAVDFTFPIVVRGLYSWRTGEATRQFTAMPSQDAFGIQLDSGASKSLTSKLDSRRRYMNELSNTVGQLTQKGGKRYSSRTDNGHEMASFLAVRTPWVASCRRTYTSGKTKKTHAFTGWCNFTGLTTMPNYTGKTFPFRTGAYSPLATGTQLRGYQNSAYYSARPDPPSTTLLTTVIELLRGDLPSIVGNLRKFITQTDRKKFLSYAGSESLNIQFGWAPIIGEFANVLKILLQLDSMVYGDSNYRRHRAIDGPTVSSSTRESGGFTNLNTPFNAGTVMVKGTTGGSRGLQCATVEYLRTSTVTENYRFSAKFRGLAKPDAKATRYYENAQRILRDLGVGDPAILWELTPWSWLIDYFAHIGQAITNASVYSPQSGQYAQDYAYWTRQTVHTVDVSDARITQVLSPSDSFDELRITSRPSYVIRSRVREHVSPFGFGTKFGSLSAGQLGILVSLGLARSHV